MSVKNRLRLILLGVYNTKMVIGSILLLFCYIHLNTEFVIGIT